MKKVRQLREKVIDYCTHEIDLKSPRTKKAIVLLGYTERELYRKYYFLIKNN